MTHTLSSLIESAVAQRSLLQHPFYKAWSAGELTKDHLLGYAKEYYWAALHVPAVMEAVATKMPEDLSDHQRATFAHNAFEEEEHIELWERFAAALGISKEELKAYEPTETVKNAMSVIVKAASRSFEEGIATMYAFECELPAISKSKIQGLVDYYALRTEDAHAYFEEHLAEEKHLCFWRDLLNNMPAEKRDVALVAAHDTVSAQNRILDGVVERYLPDMECACTS